jgi:hypothetical protein
MTVAVGITAFACGSFVGGSAAPEPGIVRARGLQIVDDAGRIRASIAILPASHDQAETVLVRLIDEHGRPEVKIGASDRGAAMSLCGPRDPGCVVAGADDDAPSVKLLGKTGTKTLAP